MGEIEECAETEMIMTPPANDKLKTISLEKMDKDEKFGKSPENFSIS